MMRSLIVYFSRTEVAHFLSNREEGDTRPFSVVQASGIPPLARPAPAEGGSIMAGHVRSERSPGTPGAVRVISATWPRSEPAGIPER